MDRKDKSLVEDYESLESKENALGVWRSASLLAFNGFLFATVADFEEPSSSSFMERVVPFVGLSISLSVFFASLISLYKKATHSRNRQRIISYTFMQFLGPYVFNSFILVCFWISYILCLFGSLCNCKILLIGN